MTFGANRGVTTDQGGVWLSPRAAEVVLGHPRRNEHAGDHDDAPVEDLNPRERDVLRPIARRGWRQGS
jgi:DNA-binding NarL/FixJ family response regulator